LTSYKALCPGVYWAGAKNPGLRRFDVVMRTEYGTTYNACLVVGNEKTALVETVKDRFARIQLDGIREVMNVEDLDYIILDHTEPDHSGSLLEVLKEAPHAQVYCSRAAASLLREITNEDIGFHIAQDGDTLDLGGATLEFIMAPFLHWPDSMFTYCKEKKLLISGDVFGCHFSDDEILESRMDDTYLQAQKYYFDMIMGPFKKYVLEAVDKIKGREIDIIAPAHGPILDREPWRVVERYEKWAREGLAPNNPKRVFIGYASCYGYTRQLGEELFRAMEDAGLAVDFVDIGLEENAARMANAADGVLFGSPTLNRDALPPIWQKMSELSALTNRAKPAGVFGSYGWSGEACKLMEARLNDLGYKVRGSFRTKLKPDEAALKKAYDFGAEFAEAVKNQ
jgi:flavorubredoxin